VAQSGLGVLRGVNPKLRGNGLRPAMHMIRVTPVPCLLLGHGASRKSPGVGRKPTAEGDVPPRTRPLHQGLDALDRRYLAAQG
jgi:hypothetical protein